MWTILSKNFYDFAHLGFLPLIISPNLAGTVKEQIENGYSHGGGYHPMDGWTFDPKTKAIKYPGDPPYHALCSLQVRDETVYVYHDAWVCIVQPDGSFAVTRMD